MRERMFLLTILAWLFAIVLPLQVSAQAIKQEAREAKKHEVQSGPEMIKAPAGAKVRITEPADGATVSSPVKVVMNATGIQIVPAGELKEGTGHHHLIIDGGAPAYGEVIATDATHLHYGKAQTETTLELSPGKHTITDQMADGLHRSYGPEMSQTITIQVK